MPRVPLAPALHLVLLSVLPQPVPHSGSSGYGSLGSNGSHEHLMSQTSSSDSNGHEDARRRRAVGAPVPETLPWCPRESQSLPRTTRAGVRSLGSLGPLRLPSELFTGLTSREG